MELDVIKTRHPCFYRDGGRFNTSDSILSLFKLPILHKYIRWTFQYRVLEFYLPEILRE